MYVWLGIDLDNQLHQLKRVVADARKQTGLPLDNPDFPMHTSLKISFPIDDDILPQVVEELTAYFATQKPIQIEIDKPELHSNIAWLLYKPNVKLQAISTHLNEFLLDHYNVPLHEYDNDFKYHTTLFMDGSANQIATAFQMVQYFPFPKILTANTFCIGFSQSGANYTYKVIHRIVVE